MSVLTAIQLLRWVAVDAFVLFFCPLLIAQPALYLQSSSCLPGTLNAPPTAFSFHYCLKLITLCCLYISFSFLLNCEDFRGVFLLRGNKKVCMPRLCRSEDVLFVCECDFCNIRVTKKPQYEAPVDEIVWFIFLHHTCVCVSGWMSVCVCVRRHANDACLIFYSQILDFIVHFDMVSLILWTMAVLDCVGLVMGLALDTGLLLWLVFI